MKEYRIKICDGRGFLNKINLGKFYIQIKKNRIWKNYKECEYADDFKTIQYYSTEKMATKKVVELIEEELEDIQTLNQVNSYINDKVVREFSVADIAKALLEK